MPGKCPISLSICTAEFYPSHARCRYVDTVNKLTSEGGSTLLGLSLNQIVTNEKIRQNNPALFHNAAECWNHNFYWKCLTGAGGGGEPTGALAERIRRDFGSFRQFRREMEAASLAAFGAGWTWLGYDARTQRLRVLRTRGGDTPLSENVTPILAINMWEHAYYLDYQERKLEYVNGVLDRLVNWKVAEKNMKRATGGGVLPDTAHLISRRGLPIFGTLVSVNWAKKQAIRMLFRQS